MPLFDVKTLIWLLAVGHLSSVLLLFSGIRSAKTGWYDVLLGIGRSFQAVCWVLIGFRGQIPEWLSLGVANTLLMAGFALEAIVLSSLKAEISRRWYFAYGAILVAVVLPWWGFPVELEVTARMFLLSAGHMLIFAIPGYLFLFDRRRSTTLQRLMGFLYLIYALAAIWRGLYYLMLQKYFLFSADIPQLLVMFLLYLMMLLGGMGYILVKNQFLNQDLIESANTDFLTGLYNRRAFFSFAEKAIASCRTKGEPVSLLMIDVDSFKRINDRYGHVVGDSVLVKVASLIRQQSRSWDILCRFGGEEFVLLLPGLAETDASSVAERIRRAIDGAQFGDQGPDCCTVSIGIASRVLHEAEPIDALLAESDTALYRAKESGRNRVEVNKAAS